MTWIIWLIIAVVLIICEIAISIFFFVCLAVGSIVSAIFALFGATVWIQIIIFAIVSVISIFTIRPLFKKIISKNKTVKSNIDALINEEGIVMEKIAPFKNGFIKVQGEVWLANSKQEVFEIGDKVKIKEITGNIAVVERL
jgi:membrane protein implicated in regulation of membrane protease activity